MTDAQSSTTSNHKSQAVENIPAISPTHAEQSSQHSTGRTSIALLVPVYSRLGVQCLRWNRRETPNSPRQPHSTNVLVLKQPWSMQKPSNILTKDQVKQPCTGVNPTISRQKPFKSITWIYSGKMLGV